MSDTREETELDRAEIIARSREFGRRVRELEDKGQFEEMKMVRREWRAFSNHLNRKFRIGSLDAYFDEYCREPVDGEYRES